MANGEEWKQTATQNNINNNNAQWNNNSTICIFFFWYVRRRECRMLNIFIWSSRNSLCRVIRKAAMLLHSQSNVHKVLFQLTQVLYRICLFVCLFFFSAFDREWLKQKVQQTDSLNWNNLKAIRYYVLCYLFISFRLAGEYLSLSLYLSLCFPLPIVFLLVYLCILSFI